MSQYTLFFRKAILFAAPIGIYCLLIGLIDPFDYFESRLVPDQIKLKTSVPLNQCLWKMIEFNRAPMPNILLGDSRMGLFDAGMVDRASGEPYFNYSFGGATLQEIDDAFWDATSRIHLRKVYVGIDFNLYDDYNVTHRTDTYHTIKQDPLLYFVNRTVVRAAYYNLKYLFSGVDPKFGVPTVSREEYWRETVGPFLTAAYSHYVYPVRYRRELLRMAEYCRKHGIDLTFIIFPTHEDVRRRLRDFHLEPQFAAFKCDLAGIGKTIDFDFANDLTTDSRNFRDPLHYTRPVVEMLANEIWRGPLVHGRVVAADSRNNPGRSGDAN